MAPPSGLALPQAEEFDTVIYQRHAGQAARLVPRAYAAISDLFCDLGATTVDEAAISRSKLRSRAGLTIQPLDITNDASVARVDALINCAGILARDKDYEIATS